MMAARVFKVQAERFCPLSSCPMKGEHDHAACSTCGSIRWQSPTCMECALVTLELEREAVVAAIAERTRLVGHAMANVPQTAGDVFWAVPRPESELGPHLVWVTPGGEVRPAVPEWPSTKEQACGVNPDAGAYAYFIGPVRFPAAMLKTARED